MCDNGRLGSGTFCTELEEEMTVVVVSSVLTLLLRSVTGLHFKGAGEGGLRLLGVKEGVKLVVVSSVLIVLLRSVTGLVSIGAGEGGLRLLGVKVGVLVVVA
ncbi:hypothetical protein CesoFtcFv8_013730 [Champsocephalus esox]|uniref:Uncharacterized protein n=1 Tax=Champsocephalus esox TaxID=159716 RepID=A0AAN8BQZ7_9TELE|nr:hypothetical protein CesoFtcFv8_013730 [Champsocephalus esox]